jgi:hypothetical protein
MAASPHNALTAAEIIAAMSRARVAPDGTVRWTETCYCPTPLQHEPAAVLDRYFNRD